MRTPRVDRRAVLLLVAAAAAGAAVAIGLASGVRTEPWPAQTGGTWAGVLPARRQVVLPARAIVVLRTPSLAERVRAAGGSATPAQEQAWTAAALAAQNALVARLAAAGVELKPELRFTRVLDGFSALVQPATAALLERDRDVAGVYPVRIAYPAAVPAFASGSGRRLPRPPRGLDGSGVTVALLDTHVDASVAYLHGAVLPEIDVVGGRPGASKRHGTELAGLVVGRGGPGGLAGAAPGARILPIRVAGLQQGTTGAKAVFARSDQIVAGLDRAVDPNGDGDAHDAVRIALLALAEPFAGFADSPEAQAIAGAQALGTLVVAAAGNDGSRAGRFGDVAGPGGAPDALTVGAADTRRKLAYADVSVRAGDVVFGGVAPLAGPVAPAAKLRVRLVRAGRRIVARGGAVDVLGAAPPPAGALPLGRAAVPALALPPAVARAVRRTLAAGGKPTLELAPLPALVRGTTAGPAPFSSGGPSFDGQVKPEVLAPGVGLATSDPNGAGGGARWTTVSGTSAAAAAAAGDAAVLAQARPSLAAAQLRALLVGTATGGRRISAAAAVGGLLAAAPATLVLGSGRAAVTLTNVSRAPLAAALAVVHGGGASSFASTLSRHRVALAPGASATVHLDVAARPAAGAAVLAGALVAAVDGRTALRVPWALRYAAAPVPALGAVTLSTRTLDSGDPSPAVLSVDAGRVLGPASKPDIRALSRLDVVLWRGGRRLGLLARLRDVLPGRYAFGLTGRGPDGRPLRPGTYAVQVVGVPVDGGKPSRRELRFALR